MIRKRKGLRLKGYDYFEPGAYFVRICIKNRECLLGEVVMGQMRLVDAGQMISHWWEELPRKFPCVRMDAFVVMPNHIHGILVLMDGDVGAALRGRPENMNVRSVQDHGRPHRGAPTLGDIMDWFKTMTTNEYIRGVKEKHWSPFRGRLWQRGYHDRVIRNEYELFQIRQYIQENPLKWDLDPENPAIDPSVAGGRFCFSAEERS